MQIRFLADYQVKVEGGRLYKAGQVYSVSPDTASHFISRGRAVLVAEKEIAVDLLPEPSSEPEIVEDAVTSVPVERKQLKRQRASTPSDIQKKDVHHSVEE